VNPQDRSEALRNAISTRANSKPQHTVIKHESSIANYRSAAKADGQDIFLTWPVRASFLPIDGWQLAGIPQSLNDAPNRRREDIDSLH